MTSLALALVVAAAPSPLRPAAVSLSGAAPETFAVVVGHNGGAEGLADLRFADDDAVRFALFFAGLSRPENVWLLAEPDEETRGSLARAGLAPPPARPPTRTALFAALAEVRTRLAARSADAPAALYFVYAGHGLKGRFLLKPEGAPEAALTGRELRAALVDLAAERASLFFDSCRSQSLFVERGSDEGPDLSAQVADLERRAGAVKIGVLTAAQSDRPAGEAPDLKAGYFSHVLASGLAGAADADGDDVVSFGEIAAFVAFNTERLTGQRPWFDPPDGDLKAPAIDHRGRATRLVLAAAESGRFLVGAAGGAPVFAEVNKGAGRPLRLALPPGRYRVTRRLDATRGAAGEVELASGQSPEITSAALATEVSLAAAAERGPGTVDAATSGFEAPFTSDVVSALAAGYAAGREPTALSATWRHAIGLGYGAAPAPLGLEGVEHGVDLAWRVAFGRFYVGARTDLRTSAHHNDRGFFRLQRTGVLAEGGVRVRPWRDLEIAAWAAAGVRSVLRYSPDAASGDPTAPAANAGVRAEYDLGVGLAAYFELRVEAAWVAVGGERRLDPLPLGGAGMAYRR